MKGMASLTQSGAYNEEAFRYLLESESKRSERSGHLYQILLVYRTNAQGAIVPMDPDIAQTVIAAMSRCLRDTDYIGWYHEGRVVGGVLTVVGRDSVADVCNRLRPRLDSLSKRYRKASSLKTLVGVKCPMPFINSVRDSLILRTDWRLTCSLYASSGIGIAP